MNRKTFENKLVKFLPSNGLKEKIKETKHRFSDEDILKIINDYTPDFWQMVELFGQAKEIFTDRKTKNHAQKLIDYYTDQYNQFIKDDDDAVYFVSIKDDEYSAADKYIVKTYDSAFILIKNFLIRYKDVSAKDNKNSRYTITKWTTKCPAKPRDVSDLGELGECVLGYRQKLLKLDYYTDYNEYGKNDYSSDSCINAHILTLPTFLKKYDLVAFTPKWHKYNISAGDASIKFENDGQPIYGVLGADMNSDPDDDCAYIILLDSPYVKNRQAQLKESEAGYYLIYCHHDHIPFPEVERVCPENVPKEIADDYYYAVEQLKIIEKTEQE